MDTASLTKLACTQSSQALRDPSRMARALALGLRTLGEQKAFLVSSVRERIFRPRILLDRFIARVDSTSTYLS